MRKIIHIDMDCFYAAVEMRDRPELAGQPIGVGGSPEGRGVLTTANYEARKFGLKSAMPTSTALRLCPHLIMIRPDFSKYKRDSRKVRAILERFTSRIEPLSLDEAYLDVTDCTLFEGSATRIAEEIRRLIHTELGLTASAGVAPNKFLAKIAGEINKPDGIAVIRPTQIDDFVKTLAVKKIWGVGKVTADKMYKLGIQTCGDLQRYSIAELTDLFGSWGVKLYDYARGIDERPVREDRERKSLSVEETFFKDLQTVEECLAQISGLYEDWNERVMRAGVGDRIRGIYVKLKFNDFQNTTHETVFNGYPRAADFRPLLEAAFERRSDPVRLIGIGARLESAPSHGSTPQLKLF
jgi:DNA polymerase IV